MHSYKTCQWYTSQTAILIIANRQVGNPHDALYFRFYPHLVWFLDSLSLLSLPLCVTFGDSCAWLGVGRIDVNNSISEAHSMRHVTMPWLREGIKEWLVTAVLHALYTGACTSFPLSIIYAQDKSAVSVQHHKTTELPYMELHNYMPSQQTSHFVEKQTTCTQKSL